MQGEKKKATQYRAAISYFAFRYIEGNTLSATVYIF